MTLDDQLYAQKRKLLADRLHAVERLTEHLRFSLERNAYPLASLEKLDPVQLESASALIERFGKLQDLLTGVFRELIILSGEEAYDMNRVFARMEKLGILASAEGWRAMRVLRNLAADAPEMTAIAERARDYAQANLLG